MVEMQETLTDFEKQMGVKPSDQVPPAPPKAPVLKSKGYDRASMKPTNRRNVSVPDMRKLLACAQEEGDAGHAASDEEATFGLPLSRARGSLFRKKEVSLRDSLANLNTEELLAQRGPMGLEDDDSSSSSVQKQHMSASMHARPSAAGPPLRRARGDRTHFASMGVLTEKKPTETQIDSLKQDQAKALHHMNRNIHNLSVLIDQLACLRHPGAKVVSPPASSAELLDEPKQYKSATNLAATANNPKFGSSVDIDPKENPRLKDLKGPPPLQLQLEQYLRRIIVATQLPSSCVVLGRHYLARAAANAQAAGDPIAVTKDNFLDIATAVIMMGSKFLEDIPFSNGFWAYVGEMDVHLLNDIELEILRHLDFNLSCTPEDFYRISKTNRKGRFPQRFQSGML